MKLRGQMLIESLVFGVLLLALCLGLLHPWTWVKRSLSTFSDWQRIIVEYHKTKSQKPHHHTRLPPTSLRLKTLNPPRALNFTEEIYAIPEVFQTTQLD